MSSLVYAPAPGIGLDALEDELTRAFTSIRAALSEGAGVVVALDDRHVQGAGDVAQAALAHGLLGLVRSFAIEGRKLGWSIAAVSSTADVEPREHQRWVEHLGKAGSASGSLLRLGGEHLGRVPA